MISIMLVVKPHDGQDVPVTFFKMHDGRNRSNGFANIAIAKNNMPPMIIVM